LRLGMGVNDEDAHGPPFRLATQGAGISVPAPDRTRPPPMAPRRNGAPSTRALDRAAADSEPAERAGADRRAGRMTQRCKTVEFLEFCSPQVREMYEHWAALRGDRVLPHRDDLDPARITRYLPGIMLVDVLWGPPLDFVYRLVGTREVESRGTDP